MYDEKELQQIKELRESGMYQDAIAAEMNLSTSAVRRRLKAVGMSGSTRVGVKATPKVPVEPANLKEAKKREADLQDRLDSALAALDKQRSSKVSIPVGARKRKGKPFCRVVVPDTHGVHADLAAVGAMLSDLDYLQPAEVVLLGDHLDCGGFLAAHHTEHFVAETEYTFEDDVVHANEFLDQLQKRVGDVPIHYLSGNHERRIERFVLTQKVRNGKDADYLMRLFGPPTVMHLENRGIAYYREDQFHGDLTIRGTIKLGRCHFTHGSSTAKHAAANMVDKFGGNVVFGHCFSDDTEILTARGWKTFDRLLIGEDVATVSLDHGGVEWQATTDVFSHDDFSEIVHIKNACVDALVTEDHAMVSVSRRARTMQDPLAHRTLRRETAADLLKKTAFDMPLGGVNRQDDYPISDDMLRFCGWVITEGNVASVNGHSGYIRISQSDSEKGGMQHLEGVLSRLGVKHSKKLRYKAGTTEHGQHRNFDAYRFNIARRDPVCDEYHRLCPTKTLQPWMLQLSYRQWKVLFETLILADGCKNKAAKNSFQYATKNLVEADLLQSLCAVNGWRSTVRKRTRHSAEFYCITVNTNGITTIGASSTREIIPHSGRVWCCSVPNQTLIVRRNGQAFVCGNTHRSDAFVKRTVSDGAIGAWNPGCLCKLQPYYGLTNLSNWSHGYGLQIVHDDGGFLHINVPIVDGKSYLAPIAA